MKNKVTIQEFRNIVQARIQEMLRAKIQDKTTIVSEGAQDIAHDIEINADDNGVVDNHTLQDIAIEHGVELDDAAFLHIYANVRRRILARKNEELKEDIKYVIDDVFGGEAPESFNEFYQAFKSQLFDNTYEQSEVFDAYKALTHNPNQLSLFETSKKRLSEGNIYVNKHLEETVKEPIITDVVKILSKKPNAIKVNSKAEFDAVANEQRYFSASYSHCFYSLEEKENWYKTHQKSPESENSVMLFDTGNVPVQIWDDKNQIGYIIPGIKFNK